MTSQKSEVRKDCFVFANGDIYEGEYTVTNTGMHRHGFGKYIRPTLHVYDMEKSPQQEQSIGATVEDSDDENAGNAKNSIPKLIYEGEWIDDHMTGGHFNLATLQLVTSLEMPDVAEDVDDAIPAEILDDLTYVEDAEVRQPYEQEQTSSTETKVINEEAEPLSMEEKAIQAGFQKIRRLEGILEQTVRREREVSHSLQLLEKVHL
ncbi:unnamed protein product [Schistocephalus solidus]|uniref:BRCT domain-containing protein n=1 Tax=Schistocephalus solidus TaxID=70667 RepID=A0A183TQ40_SCHSO|nr:unnamed protein product [Schistocephalus solidus]